MKKNIGTLALLFISLVSTAFGDFDKNTQLIQSFKENNVRVVVVCTFQGTNNLLDVVTSSRSPGYELTNAGLAKLGDVASILTALNITYIYGAPAFRAQQTTNLLGKAFHLNPSQLSIDARLGMQNFGTGEGEDYDVYKQRFTSKKDMLENTPANGEPGLSVFNRTQDFLGSLQNLNNQTVLIVTHTFNFCHISRVLTGKYGEIPPSGQFVVYDFNKM